MIETRTAVFDPLDGKAPYRLGVLLVLFNASGQIFAGERNAPAHEMPSWQLPQGGIKQYLSGGRVTGQEKENEAALRELREEAGDGIKAAIIAMAAKPCRLDFTAGGNDKYRGQILTPVLLRYLGGKIDLSRPEEGESKPAFRNYDWFHPHDFLHISPAFKQPIYQQALGNFSHIIGRITPSYPPSFRGSRDWPRREPL